METQEELDKQMAEIQAKKEELQAKESKIVDVKRDKDNIIRVSAKGDKVGERWLWAMSTEKYMMVVQKVLSNFETAKLQGRGRAILRCFDIAYSGFLEDKVVVEKIEGGVETMKNKEGRDSRVSFVDITLKKK